MFNKDDALTYLKRFRPSGRILELSELSNIEMQSFPDSWIDILSKDGDKRLDKALIYWNKFEKEFALILELLKKNLVSIHLIQSRNGLSLMYGVLSFVENEVIYYESMNPKEKSIKRTIEADWNRLPLSFIEFYEFHDGWYYLSSESMGLSPSKNIAFLSDDLISPSEIRQCDQLNESKCLELFSNGVGGYLCADFSKEVVGYLLWWHDDEPNLNVKLWPIVDSWTFKGLDY